MPTLGVNIDHVATVRQARRAEEPDPVGAAVEAQLGGADCVTFHLREDRRHIIDRDVPLLKEVVTVKLNMEMAASPEIVAIAVKNRPTQCTLVPERREELTTEGGLDVARHAERVGAAVKALVEAGIIVSAFIEPRREQIEKSAVLGFHAVELWTGAYAHAKSPKSAGWASRRGSRRAIVRAGSTWRAWADLSKRGRRRGDRRLFGIQYWA
jgi:pyridoxine 5-phosphate synthase